jgi:hypothetical protein
MAITATNSGQVREPIPAGNYIARCYQMIEIGTVTEFVMNKNVTLKKVRIGWELPTELKVFDQSKGEQPLVISKEYTLSMNEKSNLRKDLKSWRGKDFSEDEAKAFDITKLLGAPCMLNIIHKPSATDPSRVYDQIAGITPLPRGINAPAAINKIFVLSYDSFDEERFNGLPDFIKTKMQGSSEYQNFRNPSEKSFNAEHVSEPIDDLPF